MTYNVTNIDDLWSHGGSGGSSTWGGIDGATGDEGASQAQYDTDASKKYAKNGGEGGSCEKPAPVAFYTYKDSDSSDPKCTSTSGHGVTRGGTYLGALEAFKNLGGYAVDVVGGTFTYDGKPHGVSVKTGGESKAQSDSTITLQTQAEGDAGVSYSVAYYDIDGNKLGSEPVMPGLYAAVVSFTGEGISGNWIEPVSIGKRQIAKPTPVELQFQCVNWTTGEGLEQEAFPALDETDYTFVPDAEAADGSTSLKSAKAAGNYQACFKLKDPSTCQWEGESEDSAEAWVPWSIELALFDPNDPQVTYWGTAYNNATTTVDYTGEPIWVRPWWTPAKTTDGRFPEWFTHWGSEDRPTTGKHSAYVMYFKGHDDHEGIVGYHENADGGLEPVTGDQVYAWMFGVDVGNKHAAVEAGDKVWYKTGEDGWKVPLAVQGDKPEGAEGYVVARDYAYATHLGVMEPGNYQAYAYFDAGASFAPISLAKATVKVKPADGAKAAVTSKTGAETKASTSTAPKTGDFSPFVVGGVALVGLLAAGGVTLACYRMRKRT